jgi:integrase
MLKFPMEIKNILKKASNESKEVYFCVETLVRSGSRIGAVLKLRGSDCIGGGKIIIHQQKGSRPLTCQLIDCAELANKCIGQNILLFPNLSYWFIYRLFQKWGCYSRSLGNKNNSVTHFARKEIAQNVYDVTKNVLDVQAVLGHSSYKSAYYYVNELRPKRKCNAQILTTTCGDIAPLIVKRGNIIYLAKKNGKKSTMY